MWRCSPIFVASGDLYEFPYSARAQKMEEETHSIWWYEGIQGGRALGGWGLPANECACACAHAEQCAVAQRIYMRCVVWRTWVFSYSDSSGLGPFLSLLMMMVN